MPSPISILPRLFAILAVVGLLMHTSSAQAAPFTLEIVQPLPGLDAADRYYKAYPGLEYNVRVGAMGGLYPYHHELTEAPAGMTIDACSGVIDWPDPQEADSGASVTVRVTDSENSQVDVSWTVTVTREGFVFLDAEQGTHAQGEGCSADCGDGSFDNPFRSIGDFYRDDSQDATYADHFVYFRAGTYTYDELPSTSGDAWHRVVFNGQYKPTVWLAYPGEQVTIDEQRGPLARLAGAQTYLDGLYFTNMNAFGVQVAGDHIVIRRCHFDDLLGGGDGSNSAAIMSLDTVSSSLHEHVMVVSNTFDRIGTDDAACIQKWYSVGPLLVADNRVTSSGSTPETIALKDDVLRATLRNNHFYGSQQHVIGGNMAADHVATGDFEFHHNLILDAYPGGEAPNDRSGAIELNQNREVGPIYIHHNTVEGRVRIAPTAPGNGPFHLYNNVFVNDDHQSLDTPSGSGVVLVDRDPGVDPNLVFFGEDPDHNLAGDAGMGIIDEDGNLSDAYAQYLGTHGYQHELAEGCEPPQGVGGGGQGGGEVGGGGAGGSDGGGGDTGGGSAAGGAGADSDSSTDEAGDCGCRLPAGKGTPANLMLVMLGVGCALASRRRRTQVPR